jgi:hypothetical protein
MTRRHPEVLVAPTVTFLAVVALVGVARIYDKLPAQAPNCGFRNTFGIPCVSCGGTRAFKSLSHGQVLEAVAFNPAIILGVAAIAAWFVCGLARYGRGRPLKDDSRRKISAKTLAILLFMILTINWVYLIIFLP